MGRSDDFPEMLAKLCSAQLGDEDAQREVAVYVWTNFKSRIRDLYSKDPSLCKDDLEQVFFLGISKAVMRAKPWLGNPFEYIAWIGRNNVLSLIRASKATKNQPLEDFHVADDKTDFSDVVIERMYAEHAVQVLATVDLTPAAKELARLLITGVVGDPTESGFNRRVAAEMKVTPQRASQVFATIRKALTNELDPK